MNEAPMLPQIQQPELLRLLQGMSPLIQRTFPDDSIIRTTMALLKRLDKRITYVYECF